MIVVVIVVVAGSGSGKGRCNCSSCCSTCSCRARGSTHSKLIRNTIIICLCCCVCLFLSVVASSIFLLYFQIVEACSEGYAKHIRHSWQKSVSVRKLNSIRRKTPLDNFVPPRMRQRIVSPYNSFVGPHTHTSVC